MPPSPRITFRLTPALEALVSDRVRHGGNVSDIMRDALETYFGLRPTSRLTSTGSIAGMLSAPHKGMSDDVSASMSASMSAMQERLGQLEARLDELSASVRPRQTSRPTKRPTPQPQITTYDPDAAYARMQALQAQGLSLAQIAAQLDTEGISTRHGQPWHKSTVAYALKTHGR